MEIKNQTNENKLSDLTDYSKEQRIVGELNKGEQLILGSFLKTELEQGKKWVAFEEGLPRPDKSEMHVFKTAFEAHEFAYENSTDRDRYTFTSIERMQKALELSQEKKENHLSMGTPEKAQKSKGLNLSM